jgi:hypothetical protein
MPPMPPSTIPSKSAQSSLSTQAMMTFIVVLLALNAVGILFLSIQFSMKQPVVVMMSSSVESKIDAISAKLASFQAQMKSDTAIERLSDENSEMVP